MYETLEEILPLNSSTSLIILYSETEALTGEEGNRSSMTTRLWSVATIWRKALLTCWTLTITLSAWCRRQWGRMNRSICTVRADCCNKTTLDHRDTNIFSCHSSRLTTGNYNEQFISVEEFCVKGEHFNKMSDIPEADRFLMASDFTNIEWFHSPRFSLVYTNMWPIYTVFSYSRRFRN